MAEVGMRIAVLLPISLALIAVGCRRHPTPSGGSAAAVQLPRVAPPLAPLALPPLKQQPPGGVVAKLISAHYDPSKLGLKELAFDVKVAFPTLKERARMQGTGTWQAGERVQVKVASIERNQRTELAPADPGLGTQIWTAFRLQTEELLEGVGTGFLSRRMEEWQKLKGETRREGEKLLVFFPDPSGDISITVGKGWVVEKVSNHSPRKFTRWMEYRHRLEQGRNLVTWAQMHVSLEDRVDFPPPGIKMLKSSEGLTYQVRYADAGGYLLPVELEKKTPRGIEVKLELRYTRVR